LNRSPSTLQAKLAAVTFFMTILQTCILAYPQFFGKYSYGYESFFIQPFPRNGNREKSHTCTPNNRRHNSHILSNHEGQRLGNEQQSKIVRHSKIKEYVVRGRNVLVKHDDELRLDSGISGNKARKLFWLNELPEEKFPKLVVSHGGHQSNAAVALAAICAKHGQKVTQFLYYTKKAPRWLRNNPSGNYARTLALGTKIIELTNEEYEDTFGGPGGMLKLPFHPDIMQDCLYIPQGGAVPSAEVGIRILAEEIISYIEEQGIQPEELAVVVPCIGDAGYLLRQMTNLQKITFSNSIGEYPYLLEGSDKHQFGQPDPAILEIWRELEKIGLCVDLLYAPRVWQVLFENWDSANAILGSKRLLYIHSGGVEGVSTQLTRYKHLGMISSNEVM